MKPDSIDYYNAALRLKGRMGCACLSLEDEVDPKSEHEEFELVGEFEDYFRDNNSLLWLTDYSATPEQQLLIRQMALLFMSEIVKESEK